MSKYTKKPVNADLMSEDEKDNEQGLGDEEVRMTRDA